MTSQKSQPLNDRYHIESLLGRQTGRRTFLATDARTGSLVVVKLLLFGPDFTWDDLKLFEREAAVLKSLKKSAIPRYLDSFEVDNELGKGFALVQTYIKAKSLQQWVEDGRTFSEDELKAIAKKLLAILNYLHRRQPAVVHRDIKPSNILLGDRSGNHLGQLRLVDFGSVQTAVASDTGTRTVVGTYGYMPPEQFGGQSVPASDLYALGSTLIYLATGQQPSELPQKEMRILFSEKVSLSLSLINWIQRLIEPSLDLRFKSAKDALKALEGKRSALLTKPTGSRLKVANTRQFEVVIPARGFHSGLIGEICTALAWDSFVGVFFIGAVLAWSTFGWLLGIMLMGHLWVGFTMTRSILFELIGCTRLRVTQSEISLSSEILGQKWAVISADYKDVNKIECLSPKYKTNSEEERISVPTCISIWAGTTHFTLKSSDRLTPPELGWLAQELSHWMDIPITTGSLS